MPERFISLFCIPPKLCYLYESPRWENSLSAKAEEKELGQISVYLAKSGKPFDDMVDWDSGIRGRPKYSDNSFKVGEVDCRFIYFESVARKNNPPWLEFANAKLPADGQISFSAESRSANGILGINVDGRLFIAAFGRSASATLKRRELELDFGVKAAMNMCGNEELRQARTQNNSITPTHIDRQVSRPTDTFVFGLSEAEDLKSISAHMKGDPKVTLQGRDHLTIKILGDEKLTWDGLIVRCRAFSGAYDSDDFVDLFPNYRNYKPATETEVDELDNLLIEALKARQFDDIQLWIPEFIPGDEYSFTYTDNDKRDNEVYAYLDIDKMGEQVDLDQVTIKRLKDKRVYAYSLAEERVQSSKWWCLYDCFVFEQKLGDGYFLLSDGDWKRVEQKFYDSIIEFVRDHVVEEPSEPIYTGISIADVAAMKNREALFNNEACVRRPQSIKFDMAQLRIGTGARNKEFCDILDLTDDNVMRIINCKPFKGASAITYLFAQTTFYCESFLKDPTFITEIRNHIAASTSPTKADYLRHIGTEPKEVNGANYQICLWLLCDAAKPLPTKVNLPLIAQHGLKLLCDHLQGTCKFSKIVLRFVPVHMAAFKRAVAPKKAA